MPSRSVCTSGQSPPVNVTAYRFPVLPALRKDFTVAVQERGARAVPPCPGTQPLPVIQVLPYPPVRRPDTGQAVQRVITVFLFLSPFPSPSLSRSSLPEAPYSYHVPIPVTSVMLSRLPFVVHA